jgi:hypothetical protein
MGVTTTLAGFSYFCHLFCSARVPSQQIPQLGWEIILHDMMKIAFFRAKNKVFQEKNQLFETCLLDFCKNDSVT